MSRRTPQGIANHNASACINWCFTLNNPDKTKWCNDILDTNHALINCLPEINYAIWQLEKGENGTEHIQGYIEFKKKKRMQLIKRQICQEMHLEKRKGTAEQASDYCQKEDSRIQGPWSLGILRDKTQRGKNKELLDIKELIKLGTKEIDIAEDHFQSWCKHYNAFKRYKFLVLPNRNWETEIQVIIGPTGTGKSRYAFQFDQKAYWKQRSIWWCGYEAHETVVIDEFYGWLKYDELLRLGDRYPLQVETKGGQTSFLAKNIIITSNCLPDTWYKNVPNGMKPFYRRVKKWIYMPKINESKEYNSYEDFILDYPINPYAEDFIPPEEDIDLSFLDNIL